MTFSPQMSDLLRFCSVACFFMLNYHQIVWSIFSPTKINDILNNMLIFHFLDMKRFCIAPLCLMLNYVCIQFHAKLPYNIHLSQFWADLQLLMFWPLKKKTTAYIMTSFSRFSEMFVLSHFFMPNYYRTEFPVSFGVILDQKLFLPLKKDSVQYDFFPPQFSNMLRFCALSSNYMLNYHRTVISVSFWPT